MQYSLPHILIAAFLTLSCGTQSGSTQVAPVSDSTDIALDAPMDCGGIAYTLYSQDIGVPVSSTVRLPMKYTAYLLDVNDLKAFFDVNKNKTSFSFAFPSDNGCQLYTLTPSQTMSKTLQEKYPELLSYRGHSEQAGHTADVDFDGHRLRVRITRTSGVFLLEPFQTDKGEFYLLYKIRDSGYPQSKFE